MYTYKAPDGSNITAKTKRGLTGKVTRWMKSKALTVYDIYTGRIELCFYSNNRQYLGYELNFDEPDNVTINFTKPFGKACKQHGCECKNLNPVSKSYMINCLGMSEEKCKEALSIKSRKSFNTSMENEGSNNPAVQAARGNNPVSYKELMKGGMTIEEARQYLVTKGQRGSDTLREMGWYDDKSNNPFSKEYWINRGMTYDEAQAKVNERNFWVTGKHHNPGTIDYWTERYYIEELERYIDIDEVDRFRLEDNSIKWGSGKSNKSFRKSSVYREKYKHLLDELSIDIKETAWNIATARSKKMWEDKGAHMSFALSLDGRVAKYGEEKGTLIHNEWLKSIPIGTGGAYSSEATKFLVDVYKAMRKLGARKEDFEFSLTKGGEFSVYDDVNGTKYSYDFRYKNKIIEYNGSLWHPRRDMMTEEEYNKWVNPFLKEKSPTAAAVEMRDMQKIDFVENLGYNLLEVWDFEVNRKSKIGKEARQKIVNKCIKFLNGDHYE